MIVHYGRSFDGTENYSDVVDCLPPDIVSYAQINCDTAESALRIATLNVEHSGRALCFQVGDLFVEVSSAAECAALTKGVGLCRMLALPIRLV